MICLTCKSENPALKLFVFAVGTLAVFECSVDTDDFRLRKSRSVCPSQVVLICSDEMEFFPIRF